MPLVYWEWTRRSMFLLLSGISALALFSQNDAQSRLSAFNAFLFAVGATVKIT
jgi:hypothetical protein